MRRRRCLQLALFGWTLIFLVIMTIVNRHHDVTPLSTHNDVTVPADVGGMTSLPRSRCSFLQSTTRACDSDCARFQRLMSSWPSSGDKPASVIYYLVQKNTIQKLNTSLHYLDFNFNDRYQYPVIVFVEPELDSEEERRTIRSFTTTPQRLFIQVVEFQLPPYITRPVPRKAGNGKSVGYRHMCRFHALGVYQQPIIALSHIEYAWRLDDDSFLYRPITYDVFALMRTRRLLYGYIQIRDEAPSLIRGLWETVADYLQTSGLPSTPFYRSWKHTKIYYTNFELSAMSIWTSTEYCGLAEHVDRQGGIYYRRWGDAPIRTIAVTLLVLPNQTHHFVDIGYKHNIYTNRGRVKSV